MEEVVQKLKAQGKSIATMESCTGGGIANAITNVCGASEVMRFSAVTYANDYKIKMGVPAEIIAEYTVYSQETASAMAKAISAFAKSDYGVGVTGKINRPDVENQSGADNQIYFTIYDQSNDKCYEYQMVADSNLNRAQNKEQIIAKVRDALLSILK